MIKDAVSLAVAAIFAAGFCLAIPIADRLNPESAAAPYSIRGITHER